MKAFYLTVKYARRKREKITSLCTGGEKALEAETLPWAGR